MARPSILIAVFCLVIGTAAPEQTSAQESKHDFVGILQLAVNPEGAKILQLSAAQTKQLTELVGRRNKEGATLLAKPGMSNRERALLLDRWVQDSEQLGNQLLSLQQREKLIQLLLARDGMVTLSRPDVRRILVLTEQQRKEVDRLLAARKSEIARLPMLQRRISVAKYERRLQALLTPIQLTRWERMAGLIAFKQSGGKKTKPSISPGKQVRSKEKPRLRFAFNNTPWRDVIDWLTREADLSLHVGSMPPGSLTYTDKRQFTSDQIIERINRFLLPDGYALIRSGKMLSVIGLQDSRRDQLLESLAEFVELSELDQRGDNDVVKCIFSIAKSDPKDVLAEIRTFVKLSTPVLLPKSKQLVVIERAAKLRLVRATLKAMESPESNAGPVRRFELKHVTADGILPTLRPLIGLEEGGKDTGPDISLSISTNGKQIFATGSVPKLAIVESVIQMLDKEPAVGAAEPVLQTHQVQSGGLQAVDDVLQTMLKGQDVRLGQDAKANRLIILATPDVHALVKSTIEKMAAKSAVFEIIELKRADPYDAITLVREMMDIPYFEDEKSAKKDHPRLDWDPRTKRIFVRGTSQQVEEVKSIVAKLEQPRNKVSQKDSSLRFLPIHGRQAQKLLETAKRFWTEGNDVLIFPPSTENSEEVIEREINPEPPQRPARDAKKSSQRKRRQRKKPPSTFVTSWTSHLGAGKAAGAGQRKIKAQVTPRGILLQSDDVKLLNRFEAHLRAIAGPQAMSQSRMAIFYLKHVRAQSAKLLLRDLRRGLSTSRMDEVDDEEPPGPRRKRYFSYMGPFVIADARLNRLIVQGTMAEIMQMERHLRIIDRDKSITEIQVRGRPYVIPLVHIKATKAAAIIRDAYKYELGAAKPPAKPKPPQKKPQPPQTSVVARQTPQPQPQQPQRGQSSPWFRSSPNSNNNRPPQSPQQRPAEQRSGQQRSGQRRPTPANPAPQNVAQQAFTQEPRMSLAIDEAGNSLIVRAPKQLYLEVMELIQRIDTNSQQATAIISFRGANPDKLRNLINGALGKSIPPRTPSNRPRSSGPTSRFQPFRLPTGIRR